MHCNSGIPPLQLNNALAGFQTKVCNSQGPILGTKLTWQGVEATWKFAALQLADDVKTGIQYQNNGDFVNFANYFATTVQTNLQDVVNTISSRGNSSYLYRLYVQNGEGKILAYAGSINGSGSNTYTYTKVSYNGSSYSTSSATSSATNAVGGNTGNGLQSGNYKINSTSTGFTSNGTSFISNLSDQCRAEVFEAAQTNNQYTLIPAQRLSTSGLNTVYMAGGILQLTSLNSCQTPSAIVLRLTIGIPSS
jgi:hypothetical protein